MNCIINAFKDAEENVFLIVNHKPGHAKPYLIAGKYTSQLGWVSI